MVADVARYPEFVPGWHEVRVLGQEGGALVVDQRLGIGPMSTWVRSRAQLQRPQWIVVRPVDERATGMYLEWHFERHVTGGCEVVLHIRGQTGNPVVSATLDAVINQLGRRMVDLFAARVAHLYGSPCGTLT